MFTKIQKTNKERWGLINEKIHQEPLLSCAPMTLQEAQLFGLKFLNLVDSDILCKRLGLKKGVSVRSDRIHAIFNEKNPPSNFLHLGYSAIDTIQDKQGYGY